MNEDMPLNADFLLAPLLRGLIKHRMAGWGGRCPSKASPRAELPGVRQPGADRGPDSANAKHLNSGYWSE